MNNIILQHYSGEMGPLEKLSSQNIKAYASKCSADYRLLRGNLFHPLLSPPCQKLHMLDEEFDLYDIVVMIDIDMFTRKGLEENIFKVRGIGRHHDIQASLVLKLAAKFPDICDAKSPYWGGAIYKLNRSTRQSLRQNIREKDLMRFNRNFEDEGIMHRLALLSGMKVTADTYLPDDSWDKNSYDPDVSSGKIIHIRPKMTPVGPKRSKMENYLALVKEGII